MSVGDGASSPASPQPMPHATSSTIATVHRSCTDLSKQPERTRSAPLPIPPGISNEPMGGTARELTKSLIELQYVPARIFICKRGSNESANGS